MRKSVTLAGVVVAIVLIVIIAAFVYWLFNGATLGNVRDVAIILLAFLTAVVILLLIVLIAVLLVLVLLLKDKALPIIDKLEQTVDKVRGTTNFVSDEVVSPLIKSAGSMAGMKALLKTLFKGSKRR
jgi:hypothetical protein